MTLEDCIKDIEEQAKEEYRWVDIYHTDEGIYLKDEDYHREKAERAERICEWLKELKTYKEKESV